MVDTAYYNPCGEGDRRRGQILVCRVGGSFNGTLTDVLFNASTRTTFNTNPWWYGFDFGIPRVIQEAKMLVGGTGAKPAASGWFIDGADHWIGPWTELTESSAYSGSDIVIGADSNNLAFRYYRIRCNAGTSGYNISDARFKIDDKNSGWNDLYSGGVRSSIITVSGLAWQHGTVVSNNNFSYQTSTYFSSNAATIPTFIFSEPKKVTGMRWGMYGTPGDVRLFRIEAANAAAGPWETIVEEVMFSLAPTGPEGSDAFNLWEATWNNETAYTRYRLVPLDTLLKGGNLAQAIFRIDVTDDDPTVDIAVPRERITFTGGHPAVEVDNGPIFGAPGGLTITGHEPGLSLSVDIPGQPEILVFSGQSPAIITGVAIEVPPGSITLSGLDPSVLTVVGTLSSQLAILSVSDVGPPPSLVSQVAVLGVAEPPPPPSQVSQAAALAVAEVVPELAVSQVATLILVDASRCVTGTCQTWTIKRRDGKIFRYTSLDRDLVYGGKIYKACGSLDPSAAQNGATLGDTGSISLSGLITDNGISESELFGGLFDDAFVTIDLIHWDDPTVTPKRLASGWVGKVSQGPAFHTMEVLSVGARLEQAALVQVVSPSCRWQFGDARCGVNVESLKIHGQIRRVINRADLLLDLSPPPDDGRIWKSGRMRFVDGVCAGMVCEYKGVDFASGQITLWAPAGLVPSPGDAVEILPGCDLNRDGGCKAYNNIINFGGFPDVPGTDAILETPDAKI